METTLTLANKESTEGLTSRLISLGKPGRQTRDDRDGFHKLWFCKKNKIKHRKLICTSDFLCFEYKGRKFFPRNLLSFLFPFMLFFCIVVELLQ